MLNDSGITEGFYSVQIGKCKQEYFYSNGTSGRVVKKREYDALYDSLVHGYSSLCNYEIGKVIEFGGKEYVLNEQRRFDIPYGEDIFDVKYTVY
uniref:Uncharacterized protein n=1 Tax=Eubacterium cellulosolvens (strain ATCC 43171 / JCM 9499 / 6) TaxID=633697 RepID=I5AW37_EUBC6